MHLQAAFLLAQEIGKFFVLNALASFKFNNSMTTRHENAVDLKTMLFLCISI